ncbi:hypothetical protein PC116_g23318 [Phytophthora cactorum]|nr:hypothetical protein PC112_g19262 [Phytophthora cactorum]KAG4228327.1 hypothetical protein PC116_g23318 [Phytophthora cactorum]
MAPFRAARNGHLEVVQWFHVHYPDQFVPEAMDQAAQNGYLHIVRWLHETRDEGCTEYAMEGAARNGHLDVVLYLMEHRAEGFPSYNVIAAQTFEVHCLFSASNKMQPKNRWDEVKTDLLNKAQSIYEKRPAFVKGCLKCLAETAASEGNIKILDWLNQLGLELRTAIPIRDAVSRGDVKLLQWLYWNRFELCDSDLLELAVQNGQLDAARWLSQHGFKITSLKLIGEVVRTSKVALLCWLVEHGPPLDFTTAMKLTMEYHHIEIAWWVSESDRVLLVFEALQKRNRKLLWWILTRTRFKDVSSRRSIRDAIQRAPNKILQWIQKGLSDFTKCQWCLATSKKRARQQSEAAPGKRLVDIEERGD